MDTKIRVSEIFSSIQGEGSTMGLPSIFLRLQGCNLLCGNPKESIKGKTQQEIEDMQGDNATWTCDTIATWRDGNKTTVNDLLTTLQADYTREFLSGSQLVITGGEPLQQAKVLPNLIQGLREKLLKETRVEIETNGTISPSFELTNQFAKTHVDQFNVSPKLANSGMPEYRRIKGKVLSKFVMMAESGKAIFKFVVTDPSDLEEIRQDFIQTFSIPKKSVYLMPGCTSQKQFEKIAPIVAKECSKWGYHFSSRLQVNLWNQTTGV